MGEYFNMYAINGDDANDYAAQLHNVHFTTQPSWPKIAKLNKIYKNY